MFNFTNGKINGQTIFFVFLLSFIKVNGQNNSIFNGGVADGFSSKNYMQANEAISGNTIFFGGTADGFASKNYTQANAALTGNNIYTGGIADGFALKNYIQGNAGLTGNTVYLGGIADGFAFKNYLQASAGLTGNTIFFGGAADGFAFGNYGGFGNELPLPVELLFFDARPVNNKVVLCSWKTGSEINSDYFTVEHSLDGKTFEPKGQVTAAGNSNEIIAYYFTDAQPQQGTTFYRLKQTDFNGAYIYSEIIPVTINTDHTFSSRVYPNPITDNANLVPGSAFADKTATFAITDINGKTVFIADLSELQSIHTNVYTFKRGNLKAGIYFYKISSSEEVTESGKLVLQ